MHLDTAGSPGRMPVSENIAEPLSSSSIFTVPDSKLLPALAVVSLKADHVPRPPTTPTSPSTTAVMSNFIPTRLSFRSWGATWRPSYLRETSGFASPSRDGFARFTSLDLDDHRKDHRPAPQALVDELGHVVVEVVLEQVDLADLLLR
jgi:hypothetical protein